MNQHLRGTWGYQILLSLSLEHHIRIVKEVNCSLVSVKIALKHMDMEMFRKVLIGYIKLRLKYAVPYLRRYIDLLEKARGMQQRLYQK